MEISTRRSKQILYRSNSSHSSSGCSSGDSLIQANEDLTLGLSQFSPRDLRFSSSSYSLHSNRRLNKSVGLKGDIDKQSDRSKTLDRSWATFKRFNSQDDIMTSQRFCSKVQRPREKTSVLYNNNNSNNNNLTHLHDDIGKNNDKKEERESAKTRKTKIIFESSKKNIYSPSYYDLENDIRNVQNKRYIPNSIPVPPPVVPLYKELALFGDISDNDNDNDYYDDYKTENGEDNIRGNQFESIEVSPSAWINERLNESRNNAIEIETELDDIEEKNDTSKGIKFYEGQWENVRLKSSTRIGLDYSEERNTKDNNNIIIIGRLESKKSEKTHTIVNERLSNDTIRSNSIGLGFLGRLKKKLAFSISSTNLRNDTDKETRSARQEKKPVANQSNDDSEGERIVKANNKMVNLYDTPEYNGMAKIRATASLSSPCLTGTHLLPISGALLECRSKTNKLSNRASSTQRPTIPPPPPPPPSRRGRKSKGGKIKRNDDLKGNSTDSMVNSSIESELYDDSGIFLCTKSSHCAIAATSNRIKANSELSGGDYNDYQVKRDRSVGEFRRESNQRGQVQFEFQSLNRKVRFSKEQSSSTFKVNVKLNNNNNNNNEDNIKSRLVSQKLSTEKKRKLEKIDRKTNDPNTLNGQRIKLKDLNQREQIKEDIGTFQRVTKRPGLSRVLSCEKELSFQLKLAHKELPSGYCDGVSQSSSGSSSTMGSNHSTLGSPLAGSKQQNISDDKVKVTNSKGSVSSGSLTVKGRQYKLSSFSIRPRRRETSNNSSCNNNNHTVIKGNRGGNSSNGTCLKLNICSNIKDLSPLIIDRKKSKPSIVEEQTIGNINHDLNQEELGRLIEKSEIFIHPESEIKQHEKFLKDCLHSKKFSRRRFSEELNRSNDDDDDDVNVNINDSDNDDIDIDSDSDIDKKSNEIDGEKVVSSKPKDVYKISITTASIDHKSNQLKLNSPRIIVPSSTSCMSNLMSSNENGSKLSVKEPAIGFNESNPYLMNGGQRTLRAQRTIVNLNRSSDDSNRSDNDIGSTCELREDISSKAILLDTLDSESGGGQQETKVTAITIENPVRSEEKTSLHLDQIISPILNGSNDPSSISKRDTLDQARNGEQLQRVPGRSIGSSSDKITENCKHLTCRLNVGEAIKITSASICLLDNDNQVFRDEATSTVIIPVKSQKQPYRTLSSKRRNFLINRSNKLVTQFNDEPCLVTMNKQPNNNNNSNINIDGCIIDNQGEISKVETTIDGRSKIMIGDDRSSEDAGTTMDETEKNELEYSPILTSVKSYINTFQDDMFNKTSSIIPGTGIQQPSIAMTTTGSIVTTATTIVTTVEPKIQAQDISARMSRSNTLANDAHHMSSSIESQKANGLLEQVVGNPSATNIAISVPTSTSSLTNATKIQIPVSVVQSIDTHESPKKSIFDGASKDEILEYLEDARERVPEILMAADDVMVLNENELIVVNQLDPEAPATPISIVEAAEVIESSRDETGQQLSTIGSSLSCVSATLNGQQPNDQTITEVIVTEGANSVTGCSQIQHPLVLKDNVSATKVSSLALTSAPMIPIKLPGSLTADPQTTSGPILSSANTHLQSLMFHSKHQRYDSTVSDTISVSERIEGSIYGNNERQLNSSASNMSEGLVSARFSPGQVLNCEQHSSDTSGHQRDLDETTTRSTLESLEGYTFDSIADSCDIQHGQQKLESQTTDYDEHREYERESLYDHTLGLITRDMRDIRIEADNSLSQGSHEGGRQLEEGEQQQCREEQREQCRIRMMDLIRKQNYTTNRDSISSSPFSSSSCSPSSNEQTSGNCSVTSTFYRSSSLSSSLLLSLNHHHQQQQQQQEGNHHEQKHSISSPKHQNLSTDDSPAISPLSAHEASSAKTTSSLCHSSSNLGDTDEIISENSKESSLQIIGDPMRVGNSDETGHIPIRGSQRMNDSKRNCDSQNVTSNTSTSFNASPINPQLIAELQAKINKHAAVNNQDDIDSDSIMISNGQLQRRTDHRDPSNVFVERATSLLSPDRSQALIGLELDRSGNDSNVAERSNKRDQRLNELNWTNESFHGNLSSCDKKEQLGLTGLEPLVTRSGSKNQPMNWRDTSIPLAYTNGVSNLNLNSKTCLATKIQQTSHISSGNSNRIMSRNSLCHNYSAINRLNYHMLSGQQGDPSKMQPFDGNKIEFQCPDCDQYIDVDQATMLSKTNEQFRLANMIHWDQMQALQEGSDQGSEIDRGSSEGAVTSTKCRPFKFWGQNVAQNDKDGQQHERDQALSSFKPMNSEQLHLAYIAAINGLPLCKSCEKKRIERKEIISEFVETELKYGRDLRIINDEFLRPMQVAGLLNKDQIMGVFLNLEELIIANSRFSNRLEMALKEAQTMGDIDFSTVNIGKIFVESAEMLHSFESYCIRQGSAACLLARLDKEKELLRIFLRVSQMENAQLRRMNLAAFLMVPVQRVTRYPLLLNRLYKVTAYHHKDREALRDAQLRVELHLEHINRQTKGIGANKIWRRISNLSTPVSNRRALISAEDIGTIKLRKTAIDLLQWDRDEAQFIHSGKLHYAPLSEFFVKQKAKSLRYTTAHALLVVLGRPNMKYQPDLVKCNLDSRLMTPVFGGTGIREAALMLFREKNGRFVLCHEPLMLKNCVLSNDCSQFNELCPLLHQSSTATNCPSRSSTSTTPTFNQVNVGAKTLQKVARHQTDMNSISKTNRSASVESQDYESENSKSSLRATSSSNGDYQRRSGSTGSTNCSLEGPSTFKSVTRRVSPDLEYSTLVNSTSPRGNLPVNTSTVHSSDLNSHTIRNSSEQISSTQISTSNIQSNGNQTILNQLKTKINSYHSRQQSSHGSGSITSTSSSNSSTSSNIGSRPSSEESETKVRKLSTNLNDKPINIQDITTSISPNNAQSNTQTQQSSLNRQNLGGSPLSNQETTNTIPYSHHYFHHHYQTFGDHEESFELHERLTKESLLIRADTTLKTRYWLQMLRYHAKDLGQWRQRRNGLANIMMVGQQ